MEAFRKMIVDLARRQVPVQTRWVEITSIKDQSCDAKDISNGLEVYDISLGLPSEVKKPVTGSRALVGIIQNQEASAFLIWAETLSEYDLKAETILFNGDANGGIIIAQKLFQELDKEKARVDAIIQAINGGVPAAGSADGGTALIASIKTGLAAITVKGQFSDSITNTNIKHG